MKIVLTTRGIIEHQEEHPLPKRKGNREKKGKKFETAHPTGQSASRTSMKARQHDSAPRPNLSRIIADDSHYKSVERNNDNLI